MSTCKWKYGPQVNSKYSIKSGKPGKAAVYIRGPNKIVLVFHQIVQRLIAFMRWNLVALEIHMSVLNQEKYVREEYTETEDNDLIQKS
jgi:hypothetical protein